MYITDSTRMKIVGRLDELYSFMKDSGVLFDTHRMYSAKERQQHKREMKKLSRLISNLVYKNRV